MVYASLFTLRRHAGAVEVNLHYNLTAAGGQQSRSRCLEQVKNVLKLLEFKPPNFQIVFFSLCRMRYRGLSTNKNRTKHLIKYACPRQEKSVSVCRLDIAASERRCSAIGRTLWLGLWWRGKTSNFLHILWLSYKAFCYKRQYILLGGWQYTVTHNQIFVFNYFCSNLRLDTSNQEKSVCVYWHSETSKTYLF
jgi:hypothetical protein